MGRTFSGLLDFSSLPCFCFAAVFFFFFFFNLFFFFFFFFFFLSEGFITQEHVEKCSSLYVNVVLDVPFYQRFVDLVIT